MFGKARSWAVFGMLAFVGVSWSAVWLADRDGGRDGSDDNVEAHSLLGEPLMAESYLANFGPERMAELNADLAAAERRVRRDAGEKNIVWHGRRLAYRGEYRRAIEVYTEGLERFPESYVLLRHRGHRYLSRRLLYAAVQDLIRAAQLVADLPDEIEPDGIPNERNEPRSTVQGNIWYHLALALYLQGDFLRALPAWLECLKLSRNDDTLCAASYWTYLTLRRIGAEDEAAELLERIHPDMDVIENFAYRDLLLMFKGELSSEVLLDDREDAIKNSTAAYGVGVHHLLAGDIVRARNVFQQIVSGDAWPAFGHLAAEAELARMTLGN